MTTSSSLLFVWLGCFVVTWTRQPHQASGQVEFGRPQHHQAPQRFEDDPYVKLVNHHDEGGPAKPDSDDPWAQLIAGKDRGQRSRDDMDRRRQSARGDESE